MHIFEFSAKGKALLALIVVVAGRESRAWDLAREWCTANKVMPTSGGSRGQGPNGPQ